MPLPLLLPVLGASAVAKPLISAGKSVVSGVKSVGNAIGDAFSGGLSASDMIKKIEKQKQTKAITAAGLDPSAVPTGKVIIGTDGVSVNYQSNPKPTLKDYWAKLVAWYSNLNPVVKWVLFGTIVLIAYWWFYGRKKRTARRRSVRTVKSSPIKRKSATKSDFVKRMQAGKRKAAKNRRK